MIIKVSGSQEQVRNFTDFMPLEVVDNISNQLPSSEKPSLFHRFLQVDDSLFHKYFAPYPMNDEDDSQAHVKLFTKADGNYHFSVKGPHADLSALLLTACKRSPDLKKIIQLVASTVDFTDEEFKAYANKVSDKLSEVNVGNN